MEFVKNRATVSKVAKEGKPVCKYGEKCYRKHPSHLQEYSHPSDEGEKVVNVEKKLDNQKLATGKITDFYGKQSCSKESNSLRKKPRQASQLFEEDSDYTIEDPFEAENKNVAKTHNVCSPAKKQKKEFGLKEDVLETSNNKPNYSGKENSDFKTKNAHQETDMKKQLCHSRDDLTDSDINRVNSLIEKLFLVKMPLDFFNFWNFCLLIKRSNPKEAISAWLGLTLVGPFDVLINNVSISDISHLTDESKDEMLCHWRYYYDVPEFQTVLKGNDNTGFHIGYFRDDPKQNPVFVASNESLKSCVISPIGDNLFIALQDVLRKKIRNDGTSRGLEALQRRLTEFCKTHNISLLSTNMNERNKKIVAKPFHSAGLVVPFENDIGYRELPLNNTNLKKLLKKIVDCKIDREKSRAFEKLQEIFTLINYANDELDFGMGLELGVDLFCCGEEYFHTRIQFLMDTAYNLLEREEFSQIITAHLKRRTKDVSNLDILNSLFK